MISTHLPVGATLVVVAAIGLTPPSAVPQTHTSDQAVRLASSSLANVPINVAQAIANVPANELKALQQLTDALNWGGTAWATTPRHVAGYDPSDPPLMSAVVNVLVPFPALSVPLGDQLNILAEAELPMNPGCIASYGCASWSALFGGWFQIPLSDLLAGTTLPEISVPVEWASGAVEDVPWSGEYVQFEPFAPVQSVVSSLLADPTGVETVSLSDAVITLKNLGPALNVAFNPYVPGSFILDPDTVGPVADVMLALEPILGRFAPDPAAAIPDPGVSADSGVVAQTSPMDVDAPGATTARESGSPAESRPSIREAGATALKAVTAAVENPKDVAAVTRPSRTIGTSPATSGPGVASGGLRDALSGAAGNPLKTASAKLAQRGLFGGRTDSAATTSPAGGRGPGVRGPFGSKGPGGAKASGTPNDSRASEGTDKSTSD